MLFCLMVVLWTTLELEKEMPQIQEALSILIKDKADKLLMKNELFSKLVSLQQQNFNWEIGQ